MLMSHRSMPVATQLLPLFSWVKVRRTEACEGSSRNRVEMAQITVTPH